MTDTALKPALGPALLTFYTLGTILGAGIYVLVGKVAGRAGALAPLAFVVAAVVALLTAFSYAALATRYPRAAGAALYVKHGLRKPWLAVLTGLLVLLTGIVSAATMINGFVGYFAIFLDAPPVLVKTALVLLLGLIAAWGVAESVGLAALITLIEIGGLLLIGYVSSDSLLASPVPLSSYFTPVDGTAWLAVGSGAFLAFYAYIGFEDTANVAEEARNPQRDLPRAILLALAVATVLYLWVALIAMTALPLDELKTSAAPLALIYQRATGDTPVLISLISLLAVLNGALVQIIMGARLGYGMAREGWLPGWLGRVHAGRRTPIHATVTVAAIIWLLAVWLPLVRLAEITSSVILLVFALVHLSLLRVQRAEPPPPGVRRYPQIVPLTGLVACLALLGTSIAR